MLRTLFPNKATKYWLVNDLFILSSSYTVNKTIEQQAKVFEENKDLCLMFFRTRQDNSTTWSSRVNEYKRLPQEIKNRWKLIEVFAVANTRTTGCYDCINSKDSEASFRAMMSIAVELSQQKDKQLEVYTTKSLNTIPCYHELAKETKIIDIDTLKTYTLTQPSPFNVRHILSNYKV